MSAIATMDPNFDFITIHCTATPEGRPNTVEEVTAWDIARFGQPSYHYVIELDGSVHQSLRHNQKGAHTAGRNTKNIGISYVGGTTTMNSGAKPKDTRTPEQKKALRELVSKLRALRPKALVFGHNEWPNVNKACPSFSVAKEIKAGLL